MGLLVSILKELLQDQFEKLHVVQQTESKGERSGTREGQKHLRTQIPWMELAWIYVMKRGIDIFAMNE